MRGLIVPGQIAGLLLSTTAMATGGALAPRTSDASAKGLTLPAGDELTDQELAHVTGEFLPVWAAVAVSLAARAVAAAIANAARGALIGAPSGVLPEAGRQLHQGEFDARALGCAALGGAIAGAIGGPLAPGAKTVSGAMGLGVGGYAGSWCGR
jgi:hypothetical protein